MGIQTFKAHIKERISQDDATDQVLTLPNFISMVRIFLVPVAVYFLLEGADLLALGLIAVCGFSDFLDGYLARKFGQVTKTGKILDPIADRLLIFTVLIALTIRSMLPIWFALAVLLRDLLLLFQYAQLVLDLRPPVPVKYIGKIGAAGLMVGMPALLLVRSEEILGHLRDFCPHAASFLGGASGVVIAVLILSIAIYWAAGIIYCKEAAAILAKSPNRRRIFISAAVTIAFSAAIILFILLMFPGSLRLWL